MIVRLAAIREKMTKAQLIGKIYTAFDGVLLEDGVGLWEGKALDEYLQGTDYEKLKSKDERLDWQKIPIGTLYKCSSSLSFFDAKGMRFHLGLLLLFTLDVFLEEEDALNRDTTFTYLPPEVFFALTHELESDYSKNRFALLNTAQMECVIAFLEYCKGENDTLPEKNKVRSTPSLTRKSQKLQDAIAFWKVRVLLE